MDVAEDSPPPRTAARDGTVVQAGDRTELPPSLVVATASLARSVAKLRQQVVDLDPVLRGGVTVAHRHTVVLEGVEVDGDAVGVPTSSWRR